MRPLRLPLKSGKGLREKLNVDPFFNLNNVATQSTQRFQEERKKSQHETRNTEHETRNKKTPLPEPTAGLNILKFNYCFTNFELPNTD